MSPSGVHMKLYKDCANAKKLNVCLYNRMYIKCITSINWASKIKSVLDSIGMSYIWYNQNVNNINSLICEASCKIKDIFKQNNTLLIERST